MSSPTPPTETLPSEPSITPIPAPQIDTHFSSTTNLTSHLLHCTILSLSDEFFAAASNLLTATPPIHKPNHYIHTGAWYDGWETRRHNPAPFDWVVLRLGCVAVIEGVEVDTAFFNGNHAEGVGVEGWCDGDGDGDGQSRGKGVVEEEGFQGWTEILPKQPCGPSRRQAWRVQGPVSEKQYTHLRLKMYPDGGIARLRVYGHAVPPSLGREGASADAAAAGAQPPLEELSSALNGGVAVSCSDQHFGVKSNLLLPGRGVDMGDGWETARSRVEGHRDWVVCRLGLGARTVERVVVDTKDFRGNFPRAVRIEGWYVKVDGVGRGVRGGAVEGEPGAEDEGWVALVKGERACQADTEHVFEGEDLAGPLEAAGIVLTHVKMTIIPDGGVKRLRVFGRRA